jgi:hypothetical protein
MKILIYSTIIGLLLGGCTTFRIVQMSRSEVQERISRGDLIHSGDEVRIITNDGKQYQFKVVSFWMNLPRPKAGILPVTLVTRHQGKADVKLQ